MSERDLEAPEADAADQAAEVVFDESEADVDVDDDGGGETPDEVDPADRADQQRSVDLGDEEYR
jgi:hypothetical protein